MSKGQVEVQFSWLYAAIAGVVLLLVFGVVINSIRNTAQRGKNIDVLDYMDLALAGQQTSDSTQRTLSLPAQMQITCYEYTLGSASRQTEYMPIFSSSTLKDSIHAYTLGWDVPFRAEYLIYLTDPYTTYVFSQDLKGLYDDMPPNISKSLAGQRGRTKTITLDGGGDVDIFPDDALYDGGRVRIIGGFVPYIDKPTLLAAIYAQDKDTYACQMEKAIRRTKHVADLLSQRTLALRDAQVCPQNHYDNAIDILKDMSSIEEDIDSLEEISTLAQSLDSINEQLNRESCPVVY